MTQHYIGVKQVEAWEQEKDGRPGYAVKYPDGYTSWSPKAAFEAAYLPMGLKQASARVNDNTVTAEMVRDFILEYKQFTAGTKTTVVRATLKNGFELVASSSCVDAANYSETMGADLCRRKIEEQVWHLLGFALQWARTGLKPG